MGVIMGHHHHGLCEWVAATWCIWVLTSFSGGLFWVSLRHYGSHGSCQTEKKHIMDTHKHGTLVLVTWVRYGSSGWSFGCYCGSIFFMDYTWITD